MVALFGLFALIRLNGRFFLHLCAFGVESL